MNRREFIRNAAMLGLLPSFTPLLYACKEEYYSVSDFEAAPKIDVHFHYRTPDDAYLMYAASLGMRLVSVNVNSSHSVDGQLDLTVDMRERHPGMMDFLGTFEAADFDKDGFVERSIARIDRCMNLGAGGIKIWKNIGMDLQDKHGNYVMADNPVFAPIFAYLEQQEIPLMAHLGEPLNCWLPLEEMTMKGNQTYYLKNPQYHMFQFPKKPSYEQQIVARDNLLARYPKLSFIGAHLGSLEWSIDEVAKRLDAYPQFTVDISARLQFLQLQAVHNRDKVRAFLTKYQDRIMYGTDITIMETDPEKREKEKKMLHRRWLQDWNFFATDQSVPTVQFLDESLPKEMQGLRLPRRIVDKIFYGNTRRIFG